MKNINTLGVAVAISLLVPVTLRSAKSDPGDPGDIGDHPFRPAITPSAMTGALVTIEPETQANSARRLAWQSLTGLAPGAAERLRFLAGVAPERRARVALTARHGIQRLPPPSSIAGSPSG